MGHIETIIIYTSAAGACIPLGGGVLLAAVTFILVPEGIAYLSGPVDTIIFFLAGGLFFFLFEHISGLHRRESPQMIAMLLDYIPESLALGGIFAAGSGTVYRAAKSAGRL